MQRCMQICSLFAMIGNREVNDQKKNHLITFVSISFWLPKAIVIASV